jgi:uncharacterized membrane protein
MKATLPPPNNSYLSENLLAVCHLVEAKIGHEINLINHRVSWLASSQSFLILAVVSLLPLYSHATNFGIRIFLTSMPVVGIALCFQVLFAVRAAFAVLKDHLLKERAELTEQLNGLAGTKLALLGPDRVTDYFGALPARWIPGTFIASWVVAFVAVLWVTSQPPLDKNEVSIPASAAPGLRSTNGNGAR